MQGSVRREVELKQKICLSSSLIVYGKILNSSDSLLKLMLSRLTSLLHRRSLTAFGEDIWRMIVLLEENLDETSLNALAMLNCALRVCWNSCQNCRIFCRLNIFFYQINLNVIIFYLCFFLFNQYFSCIRWGPTF